MFVMASLGLTGCTGSFSSGGFPDTPAQIAPGGFHGSNFGGHAPIVASHLFVLEAEAGTNGYGGKTTSLLTGSGAGEIQDITGTAATNPTYGWYYIPTDAAGGFNITGDYTCSVGRPVYLYAQGGSPSAVATTAAKISQVVAASGSPGYTTLTFTSGTQNFAPGEPLAFTGFPGYFPQSSTVLSSALTTTQFQISIPAGEVPNGTYTGSQLGSSAVATGITGNNAQVVNMAMLGLCPGTAGEFADTLNFVYMNEVSTVAMVYAMAPFATNTTTGVVQDATHIGASSTNLLGLQNAALNANQLYDIQGGSLGTAPVARTTTPGGNGVVPQATLDTLGNILASCVDSINTYNPYPFTPAGTQSSQCGQLFLTATTTGGGSGGIQPLDTATAAFNIAHLPAGSTSNTATFMNNLFALQGSAYPFAPVLASQPNDFTISISFTGGGIGHTGGQSPHDVAIDGSGNVYTTNYVGNKLVKFSPLGVPANATGFGTALNGPGSVAIDSTSSLVWLVNYHNSNVSRFGTAGDREAEFSTGQTQLQDAEIDGSANVWVTSNNANALVKLNSRGAVVTTITTGLVSPFSLAIDPGAAGNIWVADETQSEASLYTNAGAGYAGSPFTAGGIRNPTGNAVDANGNVWFGNNDGSVTALTSTGAAVAGSPFLTGNTNYSDGVAIDGLGNVWVTNSVGQTVYELNNAGVNVAPPAGYTAKPATEADGLAIDGSGDVWYDSYNAAAIYEMVGAAAPVVAPLAQAVHTSELGTRP